MLRLDRVGIKSRLGHSSVLLNPGCFSLGDHFFSGLFSYFGTNTNNPVEIGNYVMFGQGCTIQGGNHDLEFQGVMYLN
jgi:acetyltransferase-like isoleucine patch superfamily enzyme